MQTQTTGMKELSTFISPPLIQARITGAVRCIKNSRHTTLVYEDSTEETVATDKLPATIDWDNWFSIVSGIQSLRKPLAFPAAGSVTGSARIADYRRGRQS